MSSQNRVITLWVQLTQCWKEQRTAVGWRTVTIRNHLMQLGRCDDNAEGKRQKFKEIDVVLFIYLLFYLKFEKQRHAFGLWHTFPTIFSPGLVLEATSDEASVPLLLFGALQAPTWVSARSRIYSYLLLVRDWVCTGLQFLKQQPSEFV